MSDSATFNGQDLTGRPRFAAGGHWSGRACATCCSWVDGECINLVSIPDHSPDDCCEDHQTEAEYTADVEALRRFRVAIGLPARRGEAT